VQYSIFSEAGCQTVKLLRDVSEGMTAPCDDFMPGTSLAGKTAQVTNYTKGTCTPSGGDVQGDLKLEQPATICCSSPG